MADFIVVVILLIVLSLAITYIVKEKKNGTACIGCPNAGVCASKNKVESGSNCTDSSGCSFH